MVTEPMNMVIGFEKFFTLVKPCLAFWLFLSLLDGIWES